MFVSNNPFMENRNIVLKTSGLYRLKIYCGLSLASALCWLDPFVQWFPLCSRKYWNIQIITIFYGRDFWSAVGPTQLLQWEKPTIMKYFIPSPKAPQILSCVQVRIQCYVDRGRLFFCHEKGLEFCPDLPFIFIYLYALRYGIYVYIYNQYRGNF